MGFKVGDKVKCIDNNSSFINKTGVITEIEIQYDICHILLDHSGNKILLFSYNLKLISNKTKRTMKLNNMMKRLLDSKTKKLVKGGLINGDLELTEVGRDALNAILVEQNKDELLKVADEIIKEDE